MAEQISDERADELGVPRGTTRVESDEPHHYWACSTDAFNTDVDLEKLISNMKSEGFAFTVWFVPKPLYSEYKLLHFAPQVLGAHTLSRWTAVDVYDESEVDAAAPQPLRREWTNNVY